MLPLLNAAPGDDSGNGLITWGTLNEAVALGDILYMGVSGYKKAKADAATTVPAVAMAMSGYSGASGALLKVGYYRNDSWDALTVGGLLYVSKDTAGAITQTRPSGTGEQVQIVGYAVAAKIIYFNPDYTYVEIA